MAEVSESRYTVHAGWDDVPHLDPKKKRQLIASTPPYLRDARTQGIPSLGAGAIYPIAWEEVSCEPMAIPNFWRRGYGMDVGWNRTAAIWIAEDPADGVHYAYAEYYRGQEVPAVHAAAIKARGDWMKGAIDPAARGRGQKDGEQLSSNYEQLGLKLTMADNALSNLDEMWFRLSTGRLKLFKTLQNTAVEYRLYRRDENGKIIKENDHLMDALRYGEMTFDKIASVKLPPSTQGAGPKIADTKAGY